ncbi:endonuclease/exonuclease/phosphatase family protein [Cellvibrio sp. UBA7661]|uniref:endonuclease/exonuclease/phosphatase family protein n=1 Tax=Cellvibrio sp. UBA7661 TaxID=1946311 RepID=UPI002F35BE49
MKYLAASLLLCVFSISFHAHSQTLDVMSYNVRCGACEAAENPNNWKKRKYLVAHLIKTHNPDVIGLQEAELYQVEDLVEMLDEYSWIGVGRDDGRDKGETTAILFRTARLSLQSQKTLWLSQTPQQPSRGWDATYRRTLTIAQLFDKTSKNAFAIFNAHFDNEGETARQESAKLLQAEIAKIDAQTAVIVTGDFNSKADSKTYEILSSFLADAEKISSTPATGGNKTFNGFGENTETDNKIDFIFVSKPLKVLSHVVDTTRYNSLYPSDHYPLIIRAEKSVAAE